MSSLFGHAISGKAFTDASKGRVLNLETVKEFVQFQILELYDILNHDFNAPSKLLGTQESILYR